MKLTPEQHEQLLKPIHPKRVGTDQGGHSHVEAYEIAAHLTRIFGFGGWWKEIRKLEVVHQSERPNPNDAKRTQYTVAYRCEMRLHVGDWWCDDVAIGSAINLPSAADAHDMAAKTAVSQALKRCAKDLGDQFGLSLYRKGSTGPLVGRTLVVPTRRGPRPATPAEDVEEHAPEHEPEQSDVPAADPATGEVAEPADWSEAEEEQRHQEAAAMFPEGPDTDADASGYVPPTRPHEDLGGQLPPATPRERIAEARRQVDDNTRMVSNKRLAWLHKVAAEVPSLKGANRIDTDALVQGFCIEWVAQFSHRTITSRSQLTMDEAERIISRLEAMAAEAKGAA